MIYCFISSFTGQLYGAPRTTLQRNVLTIRDKGKRQNAQTSGDRDPWYQNRHEERPLYGRSFCAGIDHREQKENAKKVMRNAIRTSA